MPRRTPEPPRPEPVVSAVGPSIRSGDTFTTVPADAPGQDGPPLGPSSPERMHRRDEDARARETSPDFSDHPAHVVTDTEPAAQADVDRAADEKANRAE